MYERDNKCMSQCSECGVACEAPHLTSIASIKLFEPLQCEVVLGTLDLSMVSDIAEQQLQAVLARVTKIQGDLVIRNAPGVVSLEFLRNLRSVNNIILDNCAALVDARLPALSSYDSVTITYCPRLCEARIPAASDTLDQSDCTETHLLQYFEVQGGQMSLTEIATQLQLLLRQGAGDNITVCMTHDSFCHIDCLSTPCSF
jgi:hypothetical protein